MRRRSTTRKKYSRECASFATLETVD